MLLHRGIHPVRQITELLRDLLPGPRAPRRAAVDSTSVALAPGGACDSP
jgi:hypothetical protein